MIAAFSLGFFVLVSGLSAAPSSVPASDDDNPYGVDAPKVPDTTQSTPKVTAPTPVASPEKPKVAKAKVNKDSALAAKAVKEKAVKDSVLAVKKKAAAVKDSLKAVKVAAKKDSVAAKKDTALAKIAVKDTLIKSKSDSIKPQVAVAVKPVDTTSKISDTAHARKTKPRIVRETTINTINQMKGAYRSPKRALFMSLVIPGLGQAYVGQNTFNYSRAAVYLSTDILMGVLWYHYVVVKHDRVVNRYHHLADTGWSQGNYEDAVATHLDAKTYDVLNPTRAVEKGYCDAVLPAADTRDLNGCKDPVTNKDGNYDNFRASVHLQETDLDSIGAVRSRFTDPYQFYEMIGQEQEFITGWRDALNVVYTPDSTITGTSHSRDQYISLRAQANRYSRMQAWFVGGMVLNHIVSALDAALTARYNNKRLYESDAMWFDRLHLDGGLAFDQGWPRTHVTGSISF